MELKEIRNHKRILEATILELIKNFQDKVDLHVRKIHLDIAKTGNSKKRKQDFVNVIIKSL